MIDRKGGRSTLVATSLVFAVGLAGLGLAQGAFGLFVAWLVIGIGMGAGLYEAAFATLVMLYGNRSRSAITGITLIAGFASTVGWPLSTFMESHIGWRGSMPCLGSPAPYRWPGAEPKHAACSDAWQLGNPEGIIISRSAIGLCGGAFAAARLNRAGLRLCSHLVYQHGHGSSPTVPAAGGRAGRAWQLP